MASSAATLRLTRTFSLVSSDGLPSSSVRPSPGSACRGRRGLHPATHRPKCQWARLTLDGIVRELQRALARWSAPAHSATTASPPNKVLLADCKKGAAQRGELFLAERAGYLRSWKEHIEAVESAFDDVQIAVHAGGV